jgi:cystathionine beta-synthase
VDSSVPLRAEDIVRVKRQAGRVRDLISAEPYQTVFHALRIMQSSDISQIPVFEEKKIVGTVYEDKILNLALQGKDLRKLVIREVMGKPLPLLPRDAPIERVTKSLSHEGPAVFVDMGNGHYEILTKYDLMGTIAQLAEQVR